MSSNEETTRLKFGQALQAFIELGEAMGIQIRVSDPSPPRQVEATDDATRQAELRKHHRDDLGWLMAQRGLMSKLVGNYVALDDERIISVGPDEAVVRAGAAQQLQVPPQDVLVVPIQVVGSEDAWLTIQTELGLE